jgi:predicted acetyltransferase
MRRQLDDVRERGEPLAGLWASEGLIYQRFGYGMGALGAGFAIDRARAAFREPHAWSGTLRLLERTEAEAAIPPIFDAARPQRPGSFARSPAWWASEFFHDPEHARHGGAEAAYVLHETDGRPTGYARYRVVSNWDDIGAKGTVEVHELMSLTPGAHADLWRYLLDLDLVTTIKGWNMPADDPLPLLVAEPRRLSWTVRDALWLRIVDVAGALGGRRYAAAGSTVIDLDDAFCAWNAGRWSLETDADGAARVGRSGARPELAMSAADLAALYLGAFTVADLARAGRVRERAAGAVARADAMLRTDIAPWCPKVF